MHAWDKNENFFGKGGTRCTCGHCHDVNLMLYGVLLSGEPEWLRICTTEIKHAEKIAFLSPDAYVEIRVRDVH